MAHWGLLRQKKNKQENSSLRNEEIRRRKF
jgi:hypothetical protein